MELAVRHLNITATMKGGVTSDLVRDVSFSVSCGDKLAVVGLSGCGKTMTAMSILGLLPDNCHATGNIFWNGKDLLSVPSKKRRKLLGAEHVLIPQSGADFLNPSLTIKHQLNGVLARIGMASGDRKKVMHQLLGGVGFSEPEKVLRSYPFQLSGGMAQRVVMAMASAGKPKLVVADEPTKGIDQSNKEQFLINLDTLFSEAAVMLITHDISIAAACNHIMVMKDGRIEEYGETSKVLLNPESDTTHQLICDLPHALSYIERGLA